MTGQLVNETPLRIGVGRESPLGSSAVDIAPITIRFADGRSVPYISGSSLKGMLRSLAEAMLRAQVKRSAVHGTKVDGAVLSRLLRGRLSRT